MTRESPPNRAYLLRCWLEEKDTPDDRSGWRFSVEEVLHGRRRKGFGSLTALFDFLQAELIERPGEEVQNDA
jgi:hypothetical protein